jgi:hypothetical protein
MIDEVGLFLRRLFVLLPLRNEGRHVLPADEHLHHVGQHGLDGVGDGRIHHGRAVGQRRDVRHLPLGIGQRPLPRRRQLARVPLAEADRPLALLADQLEEGVVVVAHAFRP